MNKRNEKGWRNEWLLPAVMICVVGVAGFLQANDEPTTNKSQEEILQQLLEDSTTEPMIITRQIPDEVSVPVVDPVDPKAKMPLTVRESDPVINRQGRLGKDAQGKALFVYESDGAALNEPPLILLPCQKLERMEQLAGKKPSAKFVVTGEITVYHGKGYLLLRKVMLYHDLGQF